MLDLLLCDRRLSFFLLICQVPCPHPDPRGPPSQLALATQALGTPRFPQPASPSAPPYPGAITETVPILDPLEVKRLRSQKASFSPTYLFHICMYIYTQLLRNAIVTSHSKSRRLINVVISKLPLVGAMNKCPDDLQNDSLRSFAGVPQVSRATDPQMNSAPATSSRLNLQLPCKSCPDLLLSPEPGCPQDI